MAGIEKKDGEGRTPLIKAAIFSDIDGVRMLLDQGANVKARDMYGRTPVMEAVSKGNSPQQRQIIQLLLSRKPDLSLKDEHVRTALTLAGAAIAPRLK